MNEQASTEFEVMNICYPWRRSQRDTDQPVQCGEEMSRGRKFSELYEGRQLSEGYPGLADLEKSQVQHRAEHSVDECQLTIDYIKRLLPVPTMALKQTALVVGCGAKPQIVQTLSSNGFEAIGVEPVPRLAQEARVFLEGAGSTVMEAYAEALPVGDGTQSVVFLESVLEHVDSPEKTLAEAYRVLRPGGVVYVGTTNRLHVRNYEYRRRFFQWYPPVVKEAYIHQHLHFDPSLGNFTTRPAVHWFTYADLCRLGRSAGFYQFYSKLDLATEGDSTITKSLIRRVLFKRIRTSPPLRALALTQAAGSTIFMLKRAEE